MPPAVTLYTLFSTNGIVTADFDDSDDKVCTIAVQSDGKIVLVGHVLNTANSNFALAYYRYLVLTGLLLTFI